ncbi:hypothetical protein HK098_005171 [Nowakowskiella sp. JEL0407]|nr:hypothetical protein HK098_005171 [Nowakowskiella sp. JEL0407]
MNFTAEKIPHWHNKPSWGSFDVNADYIISHWTAVLAFLTIWALAVFTKYSISWYHFAYPETFPITPTPTKPGYLPIPTAGPSNGFGNVSASTAVSSSSAELPSVTEGSQQTGMGEGLVSDTQLAGGNPRVATLLNRLSRTSEVTLASFFMLLSGVALLSVPIAYNCFLATPSPNLQPVVPLPCSVCYTNTLSFVSAIVTWVFFGASLIWTILEVTNAHIQSSSITRFIFSLLSSPMIVVLFALFFSRYYELKKMECRV